MLGNFVCVSPCARDCWVCGLQADNPAPVVGRQGDAVTLTEASGPEKMLVGLSLQLVMLPVKLAYALDIVNL